MTTLPTRLEIGVTSAVENAKYGVYLDGKKQHDCIIADVEKGFIVRYKRHPLFKQYLIDGKTGKVRQTKLEGVVQIVLKGKGAA